MKKTKTVTINDVRQACQSIGDKVNDTFNATGDLKAAQSAISAYSTAISAAKAQLIYKKLTGTPAEMSFFKDQKAMKTIHLTPNEFYDFKEVAKKFKIFFTCTVIAGIVLVDADAVMLDYIGY